MKKPAKARGNGPAKKVTTRKRVAIAKNVSPRLATAARLQEGEGALTEALAAIGDMTVAELAQAIMAGPVARTEDDMWVVKKGLVEAYRKVFNPADPSTARRLKTLLEDASHPDRVIALLDELTRGRNPLHIPEIDTLRQLFTENTPLRPLAKVPEGKIDGLFFWHKLVTGPIQHVKDLFDRLHAFANQRTPANQDAVLTWLKDVKGIVVDTSDTAYVKALMDQLVQISVERRTPYQHLRWWVHVRNMW